MPGIYGVSGGYVRSDGGRRFVILVAVVAMLASLVTVVAPRHARADAPPTVPGQQSGDLIVDGESTKSMPGFSYNNRVSGMPDNCNSDGTAPASSGLPYCQQFDASSAFTITSITGGPSYYKIVGNVAAGYTQVEFHEPVNGYYDGSETYFAAQHGWLFQSRLRNGVSSQGDEVVVCVAGTPCEVDLLANDYYAGTVGNAFAVLKLYTDSSTDGFRYHGFSFVKLGLTRAVTGYVRDASGNGIGGATVTATGPGGETMTAPTVNSGYAIGQYGFTGVPAEAGWTFRASDAAGDIFNPTSWTPDLVNTIPTQDFTVRPGLSSSIAVTLPDGTAYKQGSGLPGDQLDAHVTLANAVGAPTLTGLTADTPLTSSAPPVTLGTPTNLSTTSLAPGESTSYDVPMTVTGAGRTNLHMAAHGTGNAREDTSTDQLLVLGSPLIVTYAFQTGGIDLSTVSPANTFVLPDNDDGEIPTDVTVSEKLFNRSGGPVDTVTVQPLDLLTVDPNAKHLPFPVTVTSGPTYAAGFDHTLADGASTTVTWTLHVTQNIELRVQDLVLSHSDDGVPNDVSIGQDVLYVRPAHELLFKVTNDDGTSRVKTGHPFTLTGTITNLDQSHSLDVDPVLPEFDGNAGGQAALSDGSPTNDGYVPPVAGVLDPGEKKAFTVTVQTIPDAGTRGIVTWSPSGSVVNSDGTLTGLVAKDMRLAAGTTPMTLSLDDSDQAPIPATTFEQSWVFSAAALESMRDWCANGFHAITDWRGGLTAIGSGLVATGGLVVKTAQALGVGINFIQSEYALTYYWGALTPSQRQAFADDVAHDLAVTNKAWKDFHDGIDNAVFSYFLTSQTLLAKGDVVGLAQLRGERLGIGLPEALSLFAPEVILNKLARGLAWGTRIAGGITDTAVGRAISLGEKLKESNIVLKAAKAIDGAVAGSDLLAQNAKILRTQFGMARRDIDALAYWAKKNNLLIAVRQRSELTLHWLKEYKAIVKPELLKIKNVDEIDAKYLGYLSHDEGSVVFREPLDKSLVQAKIRSAPPELQKAIAKRYGVRVKEWKKYEKEYKAWSGTKRDFGFDEVAQGVHGPKQSKLREFDLGKSVKVHGGGEYYQVKIADSRGILRRVTGDIDVVAITLADGRIPSAAVRSQLYQDLQEAIGMQHGETLSWLLKGELLSDVKAGLLADHLPGRELLAVFGPDGGCRAAYFDPHLTIFNRATGESAATFIGAYSTPLQRATRYAGVKLARFFQ